jgi:hypothetical protein
MRQQYITVSDETVMYCYEFSATLTTDRLHYKLQTRPLVRKGAPRQRAKKLSGKRMEKKKKKPESHNLNNHYHENFKIYI